MIRFLMMCLALIMGTLAFCCFLAGLTAKPQWQVDQEQKEKRYMASCLKENPEYKCIEMWRKVQ